LVLVPQAPARLLQAALALHTLVAALPPAASGAPVTVRFCVQLATPHDGAEKGAPHSPGSRPSVAPSGRAGVPSARHALCHRHARPVDWPSAPAASAAIIAAAARGSMAKGRGGEV
jgi:hypothetical protein